jgi:hypothetical protein
LILGHVLFCWAFFFNVEGWIPENQSLVSVLVPPTSVTRKYQKIFLIADLKCIIIYYHVEGWRCHATLGTIHWILLTYCHNFPQLRNSREDINFCLKSHWVVL